MLITGGRIGVGLFFLITGYFQIIQINKKQVNIFKTINITLFYGIVIGIISYILGVGSIKDLARGIIPLQSCTWWYVSTYILLMICSPWINEKYFSLSAKNKLIGMAFCWCFYIFFHMYSTLPIILYLDA